MVAPGHVDWWWGDCRRGARNDNDVDAIERKKTMPVLGFLFWKTARSDAEACAVPNEGRAAPFPHPRP